MSIKQTMMDLLLTLVSLQSFGTGNYYKGRQKRTVKTWATGGVLSAESGTNQTNGYITETRKNHILTANQGYLLSLATGLKGEKTFNCNLKTIKREHRLHILEKKTSAVMRLQELQAQALLKVVLLYLKAK